MNLALPFTVGKSAPTKKLIFDKGLQLKSISDKELEFITKKVVISEKLGKMLSNFNWSLFATFCDWMPNNILESS